VQTPFSAGVTGSRAPEQHSTSCSGLGCVQTSRHLAEGSLCYPRALVGWASTSLGFPWCWDNFW
jgi:hypothetical protein